MSEKTMSPNAVLVIRDRASGAQSRTVRWFKLTTDVKNPSPDRRRSHGSWNSLPAIPAGTRFQETTAPDLYHGETHGLFVELDTTHHIGDAWRGHPIRETTELAVALRPHLEQVEPSRDEWMKAVLCDGRSMDASFAVLEQLLIDDQITREQIRIATERLVDRLREED